MKAVERESRFIYLERLRLIQEDYLREAKQFVGLQLGRFLNKVTLLKQRLNPIEVLDTIEYCAEINCHEKHYIGFQVSPKEEMFYLQHKESTQNDKSERL